MRFIAAGLVLTLSLAFWAHGEVVDQILATVDTEAILQSEVMAEIAPELRRLQGQAQDEASFQQAADDLVRATLEQAIENKILLREALLLGLEIDEDVVDEQIKEIKDRYDSPVEFTEELNSVGETLGDFRIRIRKQLLARSMAMRKHREFKDQAVISESDVAQYYQDNKDEFESPERVRVRQIFLAAGKEESERAVAKARMEELVKELDAGAEFNDLAKAHSQAPGAEDGGIIGWIVKGDLVPVLEEAAFGLETEGVSGILESEGGFHILKVDEKKEAGLATLDEKRSEIEPELRNQAAAERYQEWMARLKKRSRVRVLY